MNTTWILVANRAGARLFERSSPGKNLRLFEEIAHPEGRLTNQEIGSDRPGRAFDSHGQGRHAMSTEHTATEQTAMRFAKRLASRLDDGRVRQRFAKLVLVAEPSFLGHLRAALSRETSTLVTAALDKDLPGIEAHELAIHLEKVLRV